MLGEALEVWSGGGHGKPLEGKCVCGWKGLGVYCSCCWSVAGGRAESGEIAKDMKA